MVVAKNCRASKGGTVSFGSAAQRSKAFTSHGRAMERQPAARKTKKKNRERGGELGRSEQTSARSRCINSACARAGESNTCRSLIHFDPVDSSSCISVLGGWHALIGPSWAYPCAMFREQLSQSPSSLESMEHSTTESSLVTCCL